MSSRKTTNTILLSKKQVKAGKGELMNPGEKFICYDGGARSGKTFLTCLAIIHRALYYPESRHLIARFRLNHMVSTVWKQTLIPLLNLIIPSKAYSIDEQYKIITFENGSSIWGAGLDDKERVEKIMGSEYSTIFINEATQVSFETFQMLKTRLSLKAFHLMNKTDIQRKFIIDCNPRNESHWIYKYFIKGVDPVSGEKLSDKARKEIVRRHWTPYDNPHLPGDYIEILENLTGNERERLLKGKWVNTEGLVYPNFEKIIIEPFTIPEDWPRFGAVDFGYTNPFAFLFLALDKSNETLYLYDEHYKVQKIVKEHCRIIKEKYPGIKFKKIVADHDAEDRATMHEEGLYTIPAKKDITTGIQALTDLIEAEYGYKLRVFNTCVFTIEESSLYCWPEGKDGKNESEKPIDDNNHAMDALRYIAREFIDPSKKLQVVTSTIKDLPIDKAHVIKVKEHVLEEKASKKKYFINGDLNDEYF